MASPSSACSRRSATLSTPSGIVGAGARRVLALRDTEDHQAADAGLDGLDRRLHAGSRGCAARRRASMRSATGSSMPSRTNIGSTRSAARTSTSAHEPAQRRPCGAADADARSGTAGRWAAARFEITRPYRRVRSRSTDQPAPTSSIQNVVGLVALFVAVNVSVTLWPA